MDGPWREMQHLRILVKVFDWLILAEHATAIQVIGAPLDQVRWPFQVARQRIAEGVLVDNKLVSADPHRRPAWLAGRHGALVADEVLVAPPWWLVLARYARAMRFSDRIPISLVSVTVLSRRKCTLEQFRGTEILGAQGG